jgi:organic radical activating enzyme
MSYAVKEIFYTLQGEGRNAGRPAVFCRFSGCNLWSGRESDRAEAVCKFCDTDFVGVDGLGGGKFGTAAELAIETNGTLPVPAGVDWVCVSPKFGANLVVERGNELKLVYPQEFNPLDFERMSFDHFYIQAMDGPQQAENLAKAVQFCLDHPKWSLSLQTHKLLNIR